MFAMDNGIIPTYAEIVKNPEILGILQHASNKGWVKQISINPKVSYSIAQVIEGKIIIGAIHDSRRDKVNLLLNKISARSYTLLHEISHCLDRGAIDESFFNARISLDRIIYNHRIKGGWISQNPIVWPEVYDEWWKILGEDRAELIALYLYLGSKGMTAYFNDNSYWTDAIRTYLSSFIPIELLY